MTESELYPSEECKRAHEKMASRWLAVSEEAEGRRRPRPKSKANNTADTELVLAKRNRQRSRRHEIRRV